MNYVDRLAINTIRFLCVDAIQKANSGHPGMPMGAAPTAYALWQQEMRYSPRNPAWQNRDRFILSAGHGSSLLYALLHLYGFGLSLSDLQEFRQLGSATPGHPEYGHTTGVELTTGPLGQGIAGAVGMAWAESSLAAHFNKPEYSIVDHYTYALCGDGCLMEGVSAEAASLAGTLGLGKLIVLYDSNDISIEGSTEIAFREDVGARFAAYGWDVRLVKDGEDFEAVAAAIHAAKTVTDKPSLIEVKTQIGFGAPNKQGKASAHGEPLGTSELEGAKKNLNWPYREPFTVPDEVREHLAERIQTLNEAETAWQELISNYKKAYPAEAAAWEAWHSYSLPDLREDEEFWHYEGNLATRTASEQVLNKITALVPNLIGGSADLAPSNKSFMKGRGDYSRENPAGMNLHFGVREHAMGAIAAGMMAHGGLRPYVAGFFVFSDYMKPSLRLAALMKLPVIYIMTHDSIGVGEDGPTHQPVEQLAALRATPNFTVIRPCDARETAAAWYLALTRLSSPTALVLSRQNLPQLPETGKGALLGGYILRDGAKALPDVILIATGSEVSLICQAGEILANQGIQARLVSLPSFAIFEEQSDEYKEKILPQSVRARVAVEAASSFGWQRYTGLDGEVIALNTYGASAPAAELFATYGFTVENIVAAALRVVNKA
jgi:transketolase